MSRHGPNHRSPLWAITLLLFLLLMLLGCSVGNGLAPTTRARLLQTINTTKQSSANITLAYQACEQWGELLEQEDNALTAEIKSMCRVLYASCLVRTGRDDQAVDAYGDALESRNVLSKENLQEAILGRGRALQRQLEYDEAKKQFLELPSSEAAIVAAAACALRLGDRQEASRILQGYLESAKANQQFAATGEAADMKFVLDILCNNSSRAPASADQTTTLLCRWVGCIYRPSSFQESYTKEEDGKTTTLMDLITANISPFDDPDLVRLDDKVLLHDLLSKTTGTQRFWPLGVTNKDAATKLPSFQENDDLWIHKRRSGYGSHGNSVLTRQQAQELPLDGSSLLQRMVQPSLLIEGRKFSLRIYVVCFPNKEVYVSRQGLVKLASVPIAASTTGGASLDLRVHMTNSGRESAMAQRGLEYLEEYFADEGWSYESFWDKLVKAVKLTMQTYYHDNHDSSKDCFLAEAGIPKILGFDFVVDAASQKNPWLVEVNRFPGLEARDDSDRGVKGRVLLDAWELASRRANLSEDQRRAIFGALLSPPPQDGNPSCLERIL